MSQINANINTLMRKNTKSIRNKENVLFCSKSVRSGQTFVVVIQSLGQKGKQIREFLNHFAHRFSSPMSSLALHTNQQRILLRNVIAKFMLKFCNKLQRMGRHDPIIMVCSGQ